MRNSNSSDSMPGLSEVRSNNSRSLIRAVMSAPSATILKKGVMDFVQKKSPHRAGQKTKERYA
jgi:hypothetical protein